MGCDLGLLIHLILLLFASAILVHGLSSSGFINIDCGKPKDFSYTDSSTGLLYTSDFQFIDTGEIHRVTSTLPISEYPEYMLDLRSFPIGTRNCYTISTVKQGKKYLVRPYFLYGNYDGLNMFPKFDLYLGVNLYVSVYHSDVAFSFYYDLMTVAPSNSLSVCLVNTGSGTPFISALELRPLPDNLYKEVTPSQSLASYYMVDYGGNGILRYPNDDYDRIWSAFTQIDWAIMGTTSTVTTSEGYEPPSDVMMTAIFPTASTSMKLGERLQGITNALPRCHVFAHFAELQLLKANETRIFNITLNDDPWQGLITPSYLKTTTIATTSPRHCDTLNFYLSKSNESTLPPILNAIEIYVVIDIAELETDSGDVDAMLKIKAVYKVKKNWIGDPCAPKNLTWDGLNCSYSSSNSPRVISLNLSSSGLTGKIANSIASLTELQYLDLSSNGLTGKIPDFLADMSNLIYLNLSGNKLHGTIPKVLLDRFASGKLTMSVGDDLCSDLEQCENKNKISKIKVSVLIPALFGPIVLVLLAVGLLIAWTLRACDSCSGPSMRKLLSGINSNSSIHMLSFRLDCRKLTFAELVDVTNNFSKSIGEGGFGTVYHGIMGNDVEVAVKMLSQTSSQGHKEFHAEAQLLTRIHHRNLVSLVGYCNDINHLALVYEYMEGGSLEDHLSGKAGNINVLCWRERLQIAIQAGQGLEYLHEGCKPAIVHRDVKTNNILLTQNLQARIADFGLSKIFENDGLSHMSTKVIGTRGYLDPEYYMTNNLTEKSDVYSFGIVLLELITGLPAIVTEEDKIHIVQWVEPRMARGDISDIVDKRLHGDYDINSVWKAVETAIACTPSIAIQRPKMSEVLMLLKDSLELETASGRTNHSKRRMSFDMIPMNMSSITNPSPR